MTITNRAIGEQVNLATELNRKIEAPILQSEMGLDSVATTNGHAVRWDEFSVKHNNDGTFKGIDQVDLNLSTQATENNTAVRWNEFSVKHNNDGTFKGIDQVDMNLTTAANTTNKPIRWDEFSVKHNNDGTFKGIDQIDLNLTTPANETGEAIRYDEFTVKHNVDGSFKGIIDEDISNTANIQASKLVIQKLYKKSVSVNPSATANIDGTVVELVPEFGFKSLVPLGIDIVYDGIFGTDEVITTTINATFSDGTIYTLSKSSKVAVTVSLTNSDLMQLSKDGVYINKISFATESSLNSSTVSVVVNHYGIYL